MLPLRRRRRDREPRRYKIGAVRALRPRGGGPAAAVPSVSTGGGAGVGDAPPQSESVQLLLSMGFSLPRAVAAVEQFGEDIDSMLEYLTSD